MKLVNSRGPSSNLRRGNKGAAPVLPADIALFRQFLQGLAHRDLAYPEALRQLGFVRKLFVRLPLARFDLRLKTA